jgi:hypothetical protein
MAYLACLGRSDCIRDPAVMALYYIDELAMSGKCLKRNYFCAMILDSNPIIFPPQKEGPDGKVGLFQSAKER